MRKIIFKKLIIFTTIFIIKSDNILLLFFFVISFFRGECTFMTSVQITRKKLFTKQQHN